MLVVDDDASLRMLCRVNLELDGYRVVEAATVDEARTALAQGGIDAVLLDVHLGSEDGRSFLRELHASGTRPPVALLTGSVALEDVEGAAEAIIGKPFSLDELSAVVGRLCARDSAA